MRISTAGMHRNSIGGILENQVKLAKTQTQIATGRKFQTASEDPIGATRVAGLQSKLADNAQYERNANILQSRLGYEEQTLADITSMLQSTRDSALAGANATLGAAERKMIANQVRQNLLGLLEMANRQDANGEHLFAGTSTATRPFVQGAAGVSYQGDQTTRQIRISSTQSLSDVHAGDAFIPSFNNLPCAQGEFEGIVAIDRRVKLLPARQPAGVMHLRFLSAPRLSARPGRDVLVLDS